ncbi:MAG TPA: ABC transporter permease [Glaciihabitans sp.]|jgi:osmoprotectant transport system permease protein|nr:ABC transporter permease [Glaciihabitans sp.]
MTWIANNLELIGDRTLQHLAIAVPPIILSFLLSIPMGWLANRYRSWRGIVLSIAGLFYAIPSLPLFIALAAVLGTNIRNPVNVVIALTLYGLALMIRSTADGLSSVDEDVIQSATAMGFSTASRFWRVELPLSGPVLLAGVRVVSVSTISLTTVGAVLGVESLGLLFTDGFARSIQAEIWAGIIVTMGLAVIFDTLIVGLGRLLMPWTRKKAVRTTESSVAVAREVTA